MADFRRVGALLWLLIRDALGPARHVSAVFRWWPTLVATLPAALALVGLSLPKHWQLSPAWWVVIFFGAIGFLFARSAYRLQATLNPDFPLHRVSFGNPFYAPGDHAIDDLLLFDLAFTNRTGTPVDLDVELFWERTMRGGSPWGPHSCMAKKGPLGRLELLELPAHVDAYRRASGLLAFSVVTAFGVRQGEENDVLLDAGVRLFVRLTDFVSDASVDLALPVRAIATETT
jgi:hypothetical protein